MAKTDVGDIFQQETKHQRDRIAVLYDDEANDLLGVDGIEESVIYMTVIGRPR